MLEEGEHEELDKPVVINDYTAQMGAVDQADHHCASYSFSRKTLRWWRKLFYWVLELSVVNFFILYKQEMQQSATTQLQYRKKLIMQLVGNIRNANSKKRGRPSSEDDQERLQKYLILLLILKEVASSFAWFATLKRYARRQFTIEKLVLENLDYIQENTSKTITQNYITSEETSSHR